ncbi:pol, partial [Symbiodinium necroappetens]
RDEQDRDESDSDDSAAIDLRQEQEDDLEETVKPFLRSTRSKRGSGSKKRSNPSGGGQGGGSKGKYSKGRGTGRGAAAWLGIGVVASTCRGTGLVRGPVPLRLPPRPVGRAAPFRFAAARRNRSGRVAEPVLAAASYTWALTRRVLNRLAHICTGNISAWAGVAAALAAPVLLSVQRGSVGVVDETLAAVAQQSAELVQEVGAEAARTVQVAGRAVSIIALILCAAATWFVARAVLNRLVHALKGNSLPAVLVEMVGGEATFAVQGKRTQAMHKVWIRLASKEAACGCKAFLQEGTCGHCDAAVQTALQMGLLQADSAASAPEGDRPAELGSRVIARGLAALPTQECFSGLAAKSREISCLSGLLNRGGSSPGAPAATSATLAVPAPAAATAARGPRRNKTPRAEPSSHAVLEALEAACARGVVCSLIADASQCSKTKLQWQSLKRVAAAGVNVRLAAGHSVRDAYAADGRGTAVGAGLKGLHHAKALLVVGDTTAEVIVGSLNWSTSSKANAECGLRLTVASGAPVVTDFIRDFETVFSGGSALDDAKPPAPKAAAASSSARSGPTTLTI